MSHRRIQDVNTALRESEQRYRNLVDTARDVIYTLSPDGKIKSLSPVFETITGWSRAEWIGREFLPLIHSDDLPRAATHIKAVLDGRVPPTFELRVLTKSGAYVPGGFMATPLIQDTQLVGVLGVAPDITDRKRAAEALRGLNEALEEEVKRIAHALHDEAGQLLASVHIGLADVVRDRRPTPRSGWRTCRGSCTRSRSSSATCPTSCARRSSTISASVRPSSSSPTASRGGPGSRSSSRGLRASACPRRRRPPSSPSSRKR